MKLLQKNYSVNKYFLETADLHMCYHIFESKTVSNDKKILLLHGAGVAGFDTWSNIASMLERWQYVLVPDLRGMGETFDTSAIENSFSVQQLVADVNNLVDSLNWPCFDLVGYSLGGLVAMLYKQDYPRRVEQQFLLEPALFDRILWSDTLLLREKYAAAALELRKGDARAGVLHFLNTISPNSKVLQGAQELAITRLMQRHLGFANALECVNQAAKSVDRKLLIAKQGMVGCIIGGLSVESMHNYHQHLSLTVPTWQYFSVAGTDHSLPYQKPRQIARILNNAHP